MRRLHPGRRRRAPVFAAQWLGARSLVGIPVDLWRRVCLRVFEVFFLGKDRSVVM